MFTPQRKSWAFSPRASGEASNPRSAVVDKGKGIAGRLEAATPPPPRASLGENGGRRRDGEDDDMEVWKRFREEGLLDESVLMRKDREALATRILELENELHEYQYNMGLLLIEKKEWSSRHEEIKLQLLEAEEILKREQAAHIIALSESEKREEDLQKKWGVEKQCVKDLEKMIREMQRETAEVKFNSDKKIAEARALEASLEEKNLEVERKLHSADAKLAEASRKISDINRKLENVEAHERRVQRELYLLNNERKAFEKETAEQREHLRDWEKKLQEGQKRLIDGQRSLNEREDRVNDADKHLKKKEEDLEEARRTIEATTNSLRSKEDDMNTRLRALVMKEKEADVKMRNLEKKERELLAIEEKFNAREREEIQKLVDEHNVILDVKKKEFESELEEKRKLFEEEVKSKLEAVDKRMKEIQHKEEDILKREQALDSKFEQLGLKEKDLDTKSKALKKWEDSVKSDEKKLQEEKQQVMMNKQELLASITELETLKAAIQAEEQKFVHEKENLKVTKEERELLCHLQSKLKQETDEYRERTESIIKEREALREEREKFEREWESLDEKKTALENEMKKLTDERETFEKWRCNEQERLRNEEVQVKREIEEHMENLRLKEEAFEKTMEHKQLLASEDLKKQQADVDREFQMRMHDLEMNMQKKQEAMEKKLQAKEDEFKLGREKELNHVTSLASSNDSKLRKLKIEQDQLEKEKVQLSLEKKKLEAERVEVIKDIDKLRGLTKNLKDQRSVFVKEKEAFLAALERCQTCHNCGVRINGLDDLAFKLPTAEIEDADVLLPSLVDGYMEEHLKSKQTISPQGTGSRPFGSGFLQKCSRIFKFSPGKNAENSAAEQPFEFGKRLDMVASDDAPNNGLATTSLDAERAQLGRDGRINEDLNTLDKTGDEPEPSLGVGDNSIEIVMTSEYDVRQPEAGYVIGSVNEHNETEGSSRPPENDLQPETSKQQCRQPNKRGRPKRTRSVKAVVEDAKTILGEASNLNVDGEPNGDAKDSLHPDEESQGVSAHTDQIVAGRRQKRRRPQTSEMTTSELEAEDSEAHSQSVSMGGHRKRRQTSAATMQGLGDRRYNFRRSTIASSVAASQDAVDQKKGQKGASHQRSSDNEISKAERTAEGTSPDGATVSPSGLADENNQLTHTLQKCMTRSVPEVSSEQEAREAYIESDVIRSAELSERTKDDGDEVDGAAASEPATPSAGSSAGDDGDDLEDDEETEKHNASIGKKLWKFFTT